MSTYKTLKHPFGFDDGERVVPAEVADGETVRCPRDDCDEPLHVRGPSTNGTVRHFYHPGSGNSGGVSHTGGGIGESATHKNYKSHAASALLNFFGDFIEESTVEEIFEQRVTIADENRYRQADTLVTFDTPSSTYGKGIIIEVQHKNHGKDKDTVEREYLEAGYSVYWTNSDDHYSPKKYLFDRAQLDEEIVTVWPNAVPESAEWNEVSGDAAALWTDFENKYGLQTDRKAHEIRNLSHRGRLEVNFPSAFSRVPPVERTVALPREWYEDRARQYFRETSWGDFFTEYEWDARTSLPMPDNGAKRNEHVDATLLNEWTITVAENTFRSMPWDDLFPGDAMPDEYFATERTIPATFPDEWLLETLRDQIVDSLDGRDIPFPGQLWPTPKRCLKNACLPGEHDWIELTGSPESNWRECRTCGLNDVTWFALYGEDASQGEVV